jgi:hypothetical protein
VGKKMLLCFKMQPGSRYNGGPFRGTYPTIGLPPGSSSQELLFHVVSSDQTGPDGKSFELVSLVPKDWVDVDFKYFLHPHPDFNVNGLYTWEWLLINFKKRRYPELTFVEYDIMDLTTECPGKFCKKISYLRLKCCNLFPNYIFVHV